MSFGLTILTADRGRSVDQGICTVLVLRLPVAEVEVEIEGIEERLSRDWK